MTKLQNLFTPSITELRPHTIIIQQIKLIRKVFVGLKTQPTDYKFLIFGANNLYNFTIGTMINNPVFHYSYSGMMGTWQNYLRIFFGIEIKIPTEREYTAIIDSHYFREEAEVFPSQKSVYVQDGFVVVKLDENPPVAF